LRNSDSNLNESEKLNVLKKRRRFLNENEKDEKKLKDTDCVVDHYPVPHLARVTIKHAAVDASDRTVAMAIGVEITVVDDKPKFF